MLASWLLLVLAIWGGLWTLAALVPSKGRILLLPTFFMSWFTIELAVHHIVIQVVGTVVLVGLGALDAWPGWVGLALAVTSWVALAGMVLAARRSAVIMKEALADLAGGDDAERRFPRRMVAFPFLMRRHPDVRVTRDIEYHRAGGRRIRLDVYEPRHADPGDGLRPGVLQIHGGAWVVGDKREQGIPLLSHLVANGWVGFNANYRLSPFANWPDHVVDLKRAVAWIRAHATQYGVDPDFIAVTGGSAGGHLTALMALTANDPTYQPGFADADTSLQAAVPFYGVYDFTNRNGHSDADMRRLFLEPWVMKAFYDEEPERFADASPLDQVAAAAPPHLVIHGDRDTLAPVEDARLYVDALRAVATEPMLYAELRGSQHAFDIFPSVRSVHVIEGVERFLRAVRQGRLPEGGDEELSSATGAPPAGSPAS